MSATCGTCQHWTPRTDFRQTVRLPIGGGYDATRYALAQEADTLYRECTAIGMGPTELGSPLPLALAMDGSEYLAVVYTRAGFGCTLHQERTLDPTPPKPDPTPPEAHR